MSRIENARFYNKNRSLIYIMHRHYEDFICNDFDINYKNVGSKISYNEAWTSDFTKAKIFKSFEEAEQFILTYYKPTSIGLEKSPIICAMDPFESMNKVYQFKENELN